MESLQSQISEAQTCATSVLCMADSGVITLGEAITESQECWEKIIRANRYDRETPPELTDIKKQHAVIVAQLIEKEFSLTESCMQISSIWVDYLNRMRAPGTPLLVISKYRQEQYFTN